jgi:hypothetical protein
MKDISSNLLAVQSIVPILANNTGEGTGVGVDLAGFDGAMMLAHIGQSGDTLSGSLYWTVSFQESDALGSGYANIAAGDLEGGDNDVVVDAAAEDEIVLQRGYMGAKRYLRVLCTATGTHTNGTPLSAMIVKGRPMHAPTS